MSSAVDRLMAGFQETFFREDFEGETIIDFACGFGTWGHTIRSMIIQGGDKAYIVGCDVFKPFLVKNKKYNPYDDLVLCDAHYLPFQNKCANVVLCFEMIEHMDKSSGYTFLSDLDNLAKDRLVLSTPNGYMEQDNAGELQFEEHKSFWLDKDFQQNGFCVKKFGMGINLEFTFRNLRITNVMDKIDRLRSRNRWNGVMLLAEKNHSSDHKSALTYSERAQLLVK
jgi:SAM-dependent methyltransferase